MTKTAKTTKTPRTTQTKKRQAAGQRARKTPTGATSRKRRPAGQPAQKTGRSATSKKASHRANPAKSGAAARGSTKQAILIEMLRRPEGATIAQMTAKTGWQAHSVRGAISGSLKKKLGLKVVSEKADDGPRRYRIIEDRAAGRS